MDCSHGTEPSLFCCDCLEEEAAVMAAAFEKRLRDALAERTEACIKVVKAHFSPRYAETCATAIRKLNEGQV